MGKVVLSTQAQYVKEIESMKKSFKEIGRQLIKVTKEDTYNSFTSIDQKKIQESIRICEEELKMERIYEKIQ